MKFLKNEIKEKRKSWFPIAKTTLESEKVPHMMSWVLIKKRTTAVLYKVEEISSL